MLAQCYGPALVAFSPFMAVGGVVAGGEALRGVLAAVLCLPVRRGLVDFLLQKVVEFAASAIVQFDCSGTYVDTAVILEHENLLVQVR